MKRVSVLNHWPGVFSTGAKICAGGDHLQLPPTVLSNEAARLGLNKSILELSISSIHNIFYWIRNTACDNPSPGSPVIILQRLLQTATHLDNTGTHISFIDTAGSGFNEERGANGMSLQNEGELRIVKNCWRQKTSMYLKPLLFLRMPGR